MKQTFDEAANPSQLADLQAKALEQHILMASKGSDGDDSVAGGYRAKGGTTTGNRHISSKKKSSEHYLDIIQLQQMQIREDLNVMMGDLEQMGEYLHKIDLRMAERQQAIDFITQNIFDADDLRDASGERNERVQALLKKHGKGHLSDDEAYLFLTGELTQTLYDEQNINQAARDDLKDQIDQKQQDILARIKDGRDAGMDMTEHEEQATLKFSRVNESVKMAEEVVMKDNIEYADQTQSTGSVAFLLNDDLSL